MKRMVSDPGLPTTREIDDALMSQGKEPTGKMRFAKIAKRLGVAPERLRKTVHCSVEWCKWSYSEDECYDPTNWKHTELIGAEEGGIQGRVGVGEAPGTAAFGPIAAALGMGLTKEGKSYQIVVREGRSVRGMSAEVGSNTLDQPLVPPVCSCYERHAREDGDNSAIPGQPGTGGRGERNVGLGGPPYKPEQNSNTYISWLLTQCGNGIPAPEGAVGWDTTPRFPFSSNADATPLENP